MANKEQMSKLPKILAVDFDGTLVEDKFPDIGRPQWSVVESVKKAQKEGWKLVLWTCRDNDNGTLESAVVFSKEVLGLEFDAVNCNIPEVQDLFNNDTRKVYANLYLDDKNLVLDGDLW
jgi:hypothetical protein